MNKEDCTFAKASDFNDAEKFDIALQYMKWCVKLQYFNMVYDDNLSHEEMVKRMSSMAALSAMVKCLSDDQHFIRCVTELQLAQESPIWDLEIADMFS